MGGETDHPQGAKGKEKRLCLPGASFFHHSGNCSGGPRWSLLGRVCLPDQQNCATAIHHSDTPPDFYNTSHTDGHPAHPHTHIDFYGGHTFVDVP